MAPRDDSGEWGIDRRSVLQTVSTAAVVGGGLLGTTGTAAAFGANCDEFRDAPSDYPAFELAETGPGQTADRVGEFPEQPAELVIFVHGWYVDSTAGARDAAATAEDALAAAGYDHPVVAYSWPSDTVTWAGAKSNADEAGTELARAVLDLARLDGTTVRLVGHGLGARVALASLSVLNIQDVGVTSTALLGAAVPDESPTLEDQYGTNIEGGTGQCRNYHSEDDGVLDYIYETREFEAALGRQGIDDPDLFSDATPPENYADVAVSDSVDAHCDYFRRDGGCIGDVVSNWAV